MNANPAMNPKTGLARLLARTVAAMLAVVLLILGLMFSLVVLAVVAVLGVAMLGYLWWKTRALRKAIRQQATSPRPAQGNVIDGEAQVVREDAAALPRN